MSLPGPPLSTFALSHARRRRKRRFCKSRCQWKSFTHIPERKKLTKRQWAQGGHVCVSRWPYVPHLVQLLSASIVPAMCLPPDRALVGPPIKRLLACDHYHVIFTLPRAQSAVAGQCAADDHVALSGRAGHAVHLIGRPRASRGAAGHPRRAPHLESDVGPPSPRTLPRDRGRLTQRGSGSRCARDFSSRLAW